jgi:hypothetical protein
MTGRTSPPPSDASFVFLLRSTLNSVVTEMQGELSVPSIYSLAPQTTQAQQQAFMHTLHDGQHEKSEMRYGSRHFGIGRLENGYFAASLKRVVQTSPPLLTLQT